MTLTITLDSETEQIIEHKAASLGLSSSDYIVILARGAANLDQSNLEPTSDPGASTVKTGAQVLAELKALNLPPGYGDPNIDSPELARQLRQRFSRSSSAEYDIES